MRKIEKPRRDSWYRWATHPGVSDRVTLASVAGAASVPVEERSSLGLWEATGFHQNYIVDDVPRDLESEDVVEPVDPEDSDGPPPLEYFSDEEELPPLFD